MLFLIVIKFNITTTGTILLNIYIYIYIYIYIVLFQNTTKSILIHLSKNVFSLPRKWHDENHEQNFLFQTFT